MLRATVSGSFHRHMAAIYESVGELRARNVDVLSPSDPRVVDYIGEFLFVASDKLRSIRLVQDRHLAAIRSSDFLWVVCPDGYTGASTCLEIGTALAAGVPVFTSGRVLDITIAEYVQYVADYAEALARIRKARRIRGARTVLVDPGQVISQSIEMLSDLRPVLLGDRGNGREDAEQQLNDVRRQLIANFCS